MKSSVITHSETCIKSGSDITKPHYYPKFAARVQAAMIFKMLKRRTDRVAKFTSESYPNEEGGEAEYLKMEPSLNGAQANSLDTNMVPDLNSTITNITTPHEFVPPSGYNYELDKIQRNKAAAGTHDVFEEANSNPDTNRILNIPVIASHDPNLVCIDDCLEPIQAVVNEYTQQLTEAFFPSDEEPDEPDSDLEQVVSRRHKLKRALQFKFKTTRTNAVLT